MPVNALHTDHDKSHVRVARLLGYGGLLPFLAALAVVLTAPPQTAQLAQTAFLGYAAIILTFVGAVHWGMALFTQRQDLVQGALVGSVVPALLAWLALLLPTRACALVLALGFILVYVYERLLLWRDLFPSWYQQLRGHLSLGVVLMLLVLFVVVR